MKQHSLNAHKIGQVLENHPVVQKVIYPGLKSHAQYKLAKKLSPKGFPGMISIQLKLPTKSTNFDDNVQVVKKFVSNLKLFTVAVSLGAVESLVDVPMLMTQGCNGVSKESLESRGINVGLIRLSVGIEDADDLIDDLTNALDQLVTDDLTVDGGQGTRCIDTDGQKELNGEVMEMFVRTLKRSNFRSNAPSKANVPIF